MHTYMSLQVVCVSSRGLLFGSFSGFLLSGRVRLGRFLSVPLLSEYIHCNRKLNITFNFRLHMYEFFFKKCDDTCSLTPLSQTVTPTRSPPRAWPTLWTAPKLK